MTLEIKHKWLHEASGLNFFGIARSIPVGAQGPYGYEYLGDVSLWDTPL